MSTGDLITLGARGSYPTPRASMMTYGGNTTAFALSGQRSTLLIDAGTGVIRFGHELVADVRACREIDWLFTHFHLDHVCGLPSFAPVYDASFRIRVHLAPDQMGSGEGALRNMFSPPYWPIGWDALAAEITFHPLGERFERDGLAITRHALNHPGGCNAYRLEGKAGTAVIATDTEPTTDGTDAADLSAFCEGADTILYDSHFTPEEYETHRGWGHSTWAEGAKLSRQSGATRLVLVHHNPERDDSELGRSEADARAAFSGTVAAREGMTIPITG